MRARALLGISVILITTTIFQQNCSRNPNFKEIPQQAEEVQTSTIPDQIVTENPVTPIQEKNCPPPTNADTRGTIASGTGRVYFETSPDGLFCNKIQFRACSNGNLSGSYTGTSCSIVRKDGLSSFSGCQTPNGVIDHGSSIMLFNESVSSECSAQIRTCNDGLLSGETNYNKAYCRLNTADPVGNNCQINWNHSSLIVPHNSRLLGFMSEKASTESGGSCSLSTARCNNGVFVGNPSLVSSCREKRIEEMPEGSFMAGHSFNSSKVSLSYKISTLSARTSCALEYFKNASWNPVPMPQNFDCSMSSAGSILRAQIDLSTVPSFNWTSSIAADGTTQYKTKLRIRFNSESTEALKELVCLKRGSDVLGATPDTDENCDGIF